MSRFHGPFTFDRTLRNKRDGITVEAPFLTIIMRTCISADSLFRRISWLSLASPLFLLRLSRDQDKCARKKLRLLESSRARSSYARRHAVMLCGPRIKSRIETLARIIIEVVKNTLLKVEVCRVSKKLRNANNM